jgi:hypothetical protein
MLGISLKVSVNPKAFEDTLRERLGDQTANEVNEAIDWLVDSVYQIQIPKKIKDFKGFVDTVYGLKRSIEKLVVVIESQKVVLGAMTSEEKKDLAVELLDELFEFPLFLEIADKVIFSLLVSFVVDELNQIFGKAWDAVAVFRR